MFNRHSDPDQIVTEDSNEKLVLARLNYLRFWGVVSLALALVSAVGTIMVGLYWLGIPVVLAYLVLGVLLVLSDRTITFDATQGVVIFSTRLAAWDWKTGAVPMARIASIYLDFEEYHDYSAWSFYTPREKIVRKWRIFLVLRDRKTVTVVRQVYHYSPDTVENLARQTVRWERLAERLCQVTDKLLVRTPTVPGRAPHTFVDVVNQIVQRRLAGLPDADVLKHRSIRLRSHPTGGMEIIVDGVNHRELGEIDDPAVGRFIREAVDEWQRFVGGYPTDR
jgi:hypothetical protein